MDKRLDTLLAQVGIHQDEATGALVGPLHFSTTYQHPEYGKSTGFDYTRTKNPTRATLEEALASIESGQFALATSSGMAAIVLAFEVFLLELKSWPLEIYMVALFAGLTNKKRRTFFICLCQ